MPISVRSLQKRKPVRGFSAIGKSTFGSPLIPQESGRECGFQRYCFTRTILTWDDAVVNGRLVVVLSVFLAIVGCNRVAPTSIEGRIGRTITDRCRPAAKCVIQLREVTPFEWDRMFYFDYGVSPAALPSGCRSIPKSFAVRSFSFAMDRWFATIYSLRMWRNQSRMSLISRAARKQIG